MSTTNPRIWNMYIPICLYGIYIYFQISLFAHNCTPIVISVHFIPRFSKTIRYSEIHNANILTGWLFTQMAVRQRLDGMHDRLPFGYNFSWFNNKKRIRRSFKFNSSFWGTWKISQHLIASWFQVEPRLI